MIFDAKDFIHLIPKPILEDLYFIQKKISEANHTVYLVGGSVRDLLMNKIPKEYDLTTSMNPENVKTHFKKVIETGIKHGTVTVLLNAESYEITTFRKDIDYIDGRRPEKVEFGNSLEEDMKRRDFTMNAIALDLNKNEFIDYNNGFEDIQNKTIRAIGNPIKRFSEDGLRSIRAIRFLSSLNFQIEEDTYNAIQKTLHITKLISRERFHDELNKILLSEIPSRGIIELYKNEIFQLFTSIKISENNDINLLKNLDLLSKEQLSLRLNYLYRFIHSENPSNEDLIIFLNEIRYSRNNIQEAIYFNSIYFMNSSYLENEIEQRKFLSNLVQFTRTRENSIYLNSIDSLFKILHPLLDISEFRRNSIAILENKNIPLELKDLCINGEFLMKNYPNVDKKKFGAILKNFLDFVLKFPEKNTVIEFERNVLNDFS